MQRLRRTRFYGPQRQSGDNGYGIENLGFFCIYIALNYIIS